MMVLAPGRFSITTGWPQSSLIFWPMRRAMMSLGPPAGKGTIIRIGRLGKPADGSWAMAASAQIASIAATRNRNVQFIGAPAGWFSRAILTVVLLTGNRFIRASLQSAAAMG